ncbi:YciI family protein [Tersicoccus sp. MR15.9]|uniref:YciI family protein n=1 Tax=Tersicoccus mangrovi TaxID=3121635 RepID=UPI002FE5E9AD
MQYLVSVIDDGQAAAAGRADSAMPEEMAAVDRFNDRLQAEGHWVFAGGLAAPDTATVVDTRGKKPVVTDGPYVESKEYLAGFWVWEVPDLDAALKLAADASTACNRKIEVRAFDEPSGGNG